MKYRSNYVPKEKKVNYRIVVPFIIVLVSLVLTLIIVFFPKTSHVDTSYTICNLNAKDSRNIMINNNTESFTSMNDYSFYGQTLGFYKDTYTPYKSDGFTGRTIFLKNLCTDKEEVYLLGSELDNKIPLDTLQAGFYEIQILEGFSRNRLTSNFKINETFKTISKNKQGKEIRLIADQSMFNNDGVPALNAQYVYLDVKNISQDPTGFDIVLDPNGLFDDGRGYMTPGLSYDDFIESKEMYEMAEKVQSILSENGYRAKIARDKTKGKNFHGEGGRIEDAYNVDAKYYIHLSMVYDTKPDTKGATAIYSNKSTSDFAVKIANELASKTSLPLYDYGSSQKGIFRTSLFEGLDLNAILRETGGKLTGAGTVNDRYKALNSFAQNSNRAMHSVIVEFGYISNPDTYQAWFSEKDKIAQALADAIISEIEK